MASVIIEGSISPCGFLARGERIETQRSDFVEALIEQGFVDVITEDEPAGLTPVDELSDTPPDDLVPPVEPPNRGASRDDWAEYLAQHPDAGIVTEGKNRSTLLEEWDAYVARVDNDGQTGDADNPDPASSEG